VQLGDGFGFGDGREDGAGVRRGVARGDGRAAGLVDRVDPGDDADVGAGLDGTKTR
jgi:hypothetical protein